MKTIRKGNKENLSINRIVCVNCGSLLEVVESDLSARIVYFVCTFSALRPKVFVQCSECKNDIDVTSKIFVNEQEKLIEEVLARCS